MLDLFTLVVAVCITHFIGAFVITWIWLHNPNIAGIKEWAIGRTIVFLSLLSFISLKYFSHWAVEGLVYLLVLTGIYIVLHGNLRFMAKSTPNNHRRFLIFLAIYILLFLYWTFIEPSYGNKAAMTALAMFVFMLLYMDSMRAKKEEHKFQSTRLLLVAFFAMAVAEGARFILFAFTEYNQISSINNELSKVTIVAGLAYSILTAIGYMAVVIEMINKKLTYISERDPLTDTLNRRSFFALSENMLEQNEHKPMSIVAMDLDHFKAINDNYGHGVGDDVLKAYVSTVTHIIRENDLFARIGGEEFVLLLPNTEQQKAMAIAERLRLAIAELNPIQQDKTKQVTCSFGIRTVSDSSNLSQVLKQADNALYQAKASGRNKVCVF